MTTQPEALRLADRLDFWGDKDDVREASSELRRQHDEIESLRQAYNIVTDDCRNLTEKVIPNIRAERDAAVKWLRFCLDDCDEMLEWQYGTDALGEMKDFLAAIDAVKGDK